MTEPERAAQEARAEAARQAARNAQMQAFGGLGVAGVEAGAVGILAAVAALFTLGLLAR